MTFKILPHNVSITTLLHQKKKKKNYFHFFLLTCSHKRAKKKIKLVTFTLLDVVSFDDDKSNTKLCSTSILSQTHWKDYKAFL